MIWKRKFTIESANNIRENTMVAHLDIKITDIGDDWMTASMPVDERTMTTFKILHGGASVTLAETIGSIASYFCIAEDENKYPVGIEINANHLKSVNKGMVHATAKPVRLGKSMHVWNIEIKDDSENLVCVSRLTTLIVEKR